LDLLEDPNEQEEVNALLTWWNRYAYPVLQVVLNQLTQIGSQIFPSSSSAQRPPARNSVLARIREKRAALTPIILNIPADVPEPRSLA